MVVAMMAMLPWFAHLYNFTSDHWPGHSTQSTLTGRTLMASCHIWASKCNNVAAEEL